jgi:DNA polymerase elongation subunit (family B)
VNRIIFDIETAPLEITDKDIADYLASRGRIVMSVHPLFSRIIHIGIKWDGGNMHFAQKEEKDLLNDLYGFLVENKLLDGLKRNKWGDLKDIGNPAQIVTYNGDSFDIPYLTVKSSIYNMPLHDMNLGRQYYRDMRTSNHFDCLTFIAGNEKEKKVKLDIACKMLGIDIEPTGFSGQSIKGLYNEGNWEAIQKKNQRDLDLTDALYKKLLGK